MIRVTVELVPFGIEESKKTIGIMNIANDGTGDRLTGNYEARLEDDAGTEATVMVKGHKRGDGVWTLIRRALTLAAEQR